LLFSVVVSSLKGFLETFFATVRLGTGLDEVYPYSGNSEKLNFFPPAPIGCSSKALVTLVVSLFKFLF
jgi:hypothetical protein